MPKALTSIGLSSILLLGKGAYEGSTVEMSRRYKQDGQEHRSIGGLCPAFPDSAARPQLRPWRPVGDAHTDQDEGCASSANEHPHAHGYPPT
jgi:hypothetical protein